MARSKYVTSRKEYKCSICGNIIEKGVKYVNVWNYYNKFKVHINCFKKTPASRWETSEYKGQLLDIKNDWDTYGDIDSLISSIEDLQSSLEDKYYNMPQQLAEGSIVEERKDAVEQVLYELDNLRSNLDELEEPSETDFETNDEYEEAFDEYENEIDNIKCDISNVLDELDV